MLSSLQLLSVALVLAAAAEERQLSCSNQTSSSSRLRSTHLLRPGAASTTHSCSRVRQRIPATIARTLRLDTSFYSKYTEAYNIPVISSSRVSDDALRRACYVLRFLLADRADVRQQLYRQGGRVGVIGVDEQTTDIPEHSYLEDWWNQRARGLGGMPGIPISTVGEENLLCIEGRDWYPAQDIMVHELAHGVHLLGVNYAITGWERELKALYSEYKYYKTKWQNTYSMSTDRELFGEGTQSYFNVNSYAAEPDGVRGPINTREKLADYDPRLYKLIKRVFPCGNHILKRCESTREQEEAHVMRMHC